MSRVIFLALFVCFCNSFGVAQTDVIFEKIDLDSHTDISIVSRIAQDNYGYIWAATEEGILKYDSHEAFLYNEYTGLPNSFSNKIGDLYIDSENQVWATSDNKMALLNRETNLFDEVAIPLQVSIIYDMLIHEESLWLATFNGLWKMPLDDLSAGEQLLSDKSVTTLDVTDGVFYLGTKSGLYKMANDDKPLMLISEIIVTSIYQDGNVFLIGTFDGYLYKIDDQGNIKTKVLESSGPIYDIIFDNMVGQYFIGSDGGGIYFFDDELSLIGNKKHDANDVKSLSSNGVYDLHADRKGQIWIATYGGGISKFSKEGNPFSDIIHITNESQSIANSFTRAILETKEGEMWYGTKEGLSIYNPPAKRWRHKPSLTGRTDSDIVMALEEDGEFVWVATYGQGVHKVNKKSLQNEEYSTSTKVQTRTNLDRVYSVCKTSDGNLYIGGIGGPVHIISDDGVSTLEISQVRDIAEGPEGEVVFVGRSGVNILKNGNLENQRNIYHQGTDFDYSTINCVKFEDSENIWIGTNGDGLLYYNINNKRYKVFNISNGLPSDIIQGILLQGDHLWASTSRGLVRLTIDDDNHKIEVYDEGDGMKNTSFNYGSYTALSDGRLAFGTTDRVVVMDPSKITTSVTAPEVILEYISILNTNLKDTIQGRPISQNTTEAIELNYKQNFIKIDFIAIDHLYPNKVKYSWQMKGVNTEWSLPNNDRSVTFAGLHSGNYTLNVKAIDRNGIAGSSKSLKIKITPPWWKSWWAYAIYGLLILATIYAGIKLAKALLTKKNADEQISFYNNITHELKTPLSILLTKLENASNDSGSIGEIKTTVKRMNGLFDQLLNFNKVSSEYYQNQKVSKITFVKHVNLIVDTFKQEIEKKDISFTFNNLWSDEYFYYKRDVLDKITFNLISNAIKYSTQGGAIILTASKKSGKLHLTVKDNGIGIPKDQHAHILKRYYRARNAINSQTPGTGLGLMIVKNLVEYDGGEISFTSEEGLGSVFTVVLPSLKSKFSAPVQQEVPIDPVEEISIASQKAKVLVVEDNDELRIDLVEKLSEYYSIVAARNGVEGLEKAKQKLPDLIITDLIMPEMDGNQLCKALQDEEDTNHIPVFMMTVLNSSTQKVESIKSGITSYMTKPIDFPFLIAKINSVLEYKQKLREKYLHETEVVKAHKFKDDREAEFITKMEDFIVEKIKEESISVQDLCKHMGMSRTALYMKLKEMIDMSLQNFIITTRMNQAKKLLLQGGVTVKEVAFQVGFNNPKYFSTSFKKQFGETPSGFLKSLNPKI